MLTVSKVVFEEAEELSGGIEDNTHGPCLVAGSRILRGYTYLPPRVLEVGTLRALCVVIRDYSDMIMISTGYYMYKVGV